MAKVLSRKELQANKNEPKLVGYWVIVADHNELFKYGKDSDTEFPFPPEQEAEARDQARYLKRQSEGTVYFFVLFDNGQMKHYTEGD